jgi:hypothetical protein
VAAAGVWTAEPGPGSWNQAGAEAVLSAGDDVVASVADDRSVTDDRPGCGEFPPRVL